MKLFSKFNELSKAGKIRFIIISTIITIFLFLGIFVEILFPNTTFAAVIDNSIGKFLT